MIYNMPPPYIASSNAHPHVFVHISKLASWHKNTTSASEVFELFDDKSEQCVHVTAFLVVFMSCNTEIQCG